MAARLLEAWGNKRLGLRKSDDAIFLLAPDPAGYALTDLTGSAAGTAAKADMTELKPNAGVRGLISSALVQFTLSDPDPAKRAEALKSIAQDPNAESLAPLRAAINGETDPTLKAQKQRLERLLTLRFDPDTGERVTAMASFGADTGLDLRAALTPLVATTRIASAGPVEGRNIARDIKPGRDLSAVEAYDLLVAIRLCPRPHHP